MQVHDFLTGVAIIAGLAGIVIVILPGLLVVAGAALVWALIEGGIRGWVVGGLAVLIAVATTFLKYQRPAKGLSTSGVPRSHLALAAASGVVGLFVIPLLGGPIFFVGTIYLLSWTTRGRRHAWGATRAALKAVISSVGIELAGGGLIALIWLGGVLLS